ncbi:uncharacterized protein BKA55DRAFT_535053 [Fusarium redolens]|uniref:Uncharacterized protein n=1 Tax=Fusarium redolens TaxID=48865 RepID=A0A9P9HXP2_FUSRE|nr:uncharacterized protein BKA55DRAFT_535053 [Fusarium redolens]KAH7265103.1 hypothetical protein BKA55DRAFT_535053 [Fusarium redolens]
MPGDNRFDALLDSDDLMRPDPAAFDLPEMARATARATSGAAAGAAYREASTATTNEEIMGILEHQDSYLMIAFTVISFLVLLVAIILFIAVIRSARKLRNSMPSAAEDDGLGQSLYKSFRNTQIHLFFVIMSLFACLGVFILVTAELIKLDNIDGSQTYLGILFGVQMATMAFALGTSLSLMGRFPAIFQMDEGAMELGTFSSTKIS